MGLIRFLGIALMFYGIWMLLRRYILPMLGRVLVKKATEKMQDQMNQQFGGQARPKAEKVYQSGNVEITKTKQSKSSTQSASSDDEYVDFEEIKD